MPDNEALLMNPQLYSRFVSALRYLARFQLAVLLTLSVCMAFTAYSQPRQAPPWAAGLSIEEEAQDRFDANSDGWLNGEERAYARKVLAEEAAARPPSGRPKPRAGGEPTGPGPKVNKSDVETFPGKPAFDPGTVRTFFLEFEDDDWERQLTEYRYRASGNADH